MNLQRKLRINLTYLAVQANVAASTKNKAFNALIFLYKRLLGHPLQGVEAVRSRKKQRIPVVLTPTKLCGISYEALCPACLPYQQTAYSRCACVSQTGEERCQNCLRHR